MSDRPNALLRLGPIEAPQLPENALAPRPTWAGAYDYAADWLAQQRAISAQRGLWDDAAGRPTAAGVLDAAQQYGNALMMGTTAPAAAPKPAFDWTPGGGTKTAQVGKAELTYGIDRTGETGEVVLVRTPQADRDEVRHAAQWKRS